MQRILRFQIRTDYKLEVIVILCPRNSPRNMKNISLNDGVFRYLTLMVSKIVLFLKIYRKAWNLIAVRKGNCLGSLCTKTITAHNFLNKKRNSHWKSILMNVSSLCLAVNAWIRARQLLAHCQTIRFLEKHRWTPDFQKEAIYLTLRSPY